jgi:lipoprotein-anchoring transpeptidase ErfK/SrfK
MVAALDLCFGGLSMRAFVLLFLGGGLIWGFLVFSPNKTDAGGREGADAELTEGDKESALDVDLAALDTAGNLSDQAEAELPEGTPRIDASNDRDLPIGRADLVEVGAVLLHGSSLEVEDWLTASDGLLGGDLENAVMAISLALEGDRSGARARWKLIANVDGLSDRMRWGATRALLGDAQKEWPAQMSGGDPLELGMSMALMAHEAEVLLVAQEPARAASLISDVLTLELDAPWPADLPSMGRWSEIVRRAQSRNRWHAKAAWASIDVEVQPGDSLTLVRQRFVREHPELPVSTGLIQKANGMSSDVIHPGQILRVPAEPVTQLVDLGDHWLLYMIGGEVVESWPVGVGREGDETITGDFIVGDKQFEPTWWPKGREPVYYGDPENPLGTRYIVWFQDGAKTSYGFHGTWTPESIGKNESDGCIRMANEAVEELYRILPVGTAFHVRF